MTPLVFARKVRRRLNKIVLRLALPLVAGKLAELKLERLGSDYGGWWVPCNHIDSNWVCYCVGVGVDATFDVALTERFGCQVHSFDPTPKAIRYMERLPCDRGRLHFHPVGLWCEDTDKEFFAPSLPTDTSHSLFDLHGHGVAFKAPCRRMRTLMQELGHQRVDLLKLDIEGAWWPVVQDIVRDRIAPRVLCVEFDSPTSLYRVMKVMRMLADLKLRLAHYEKYNAVFIDESILQGSASLVGAR